MHMIKQLNYKFTNIRAYCSYFLRMQNNELLTSQDQIIHKRKRSIDNEENVNIERRNNKSIKNEQEHVENLALVDALSNLDKILTTYKKSFPQKEELFDSLLETLNKFNDDKPIPVFGSNNSKYFGNLPATSSLSDIPNNSPLATKTVSFKEPNVINSKSEISNSEIKSPLLMSSPLKLIQKSNIQQQNRPLQQLRNYGTLQLATQNIANQERSSTDESKHVKPIILSREQEIVAELARQGHNIFYTGSAGTGKSLLLKKLIHNLKNQHPPDSIAVTASTGLAAYNIGGMTINSYTGIGLGKGTAKEITSSIRKRGKILERWRSLKVLIIDEISMIDGALLDKLDVIARNLLDRSKPFGGIQVILCGDFYQLPPISKKNLNDDENKDALFAFQSKFWKQHIKVQVILKKVFRQQGDKQFLQMLDEVRNAEVSESTTKKFKALSRPLISDDNLVPTKLFATRKEVDFANRNMLKSIEGEAVTYIAIDGGSLAGTESGKKMLESFLAPKSITLKVGAQVMMIKNIDETLVNGSLGTVVGFLSRDTYSTYDSLVNELEVINEIKSGKEIFEDDENKKEKDIADSFGLLDRLSKPNNALTDSIFDFLGDAKAKINEELNRNKKGKLDKNNDIDKKVILEEKTNREDIIIKQNHDNNLDDSKDPLFATSDMSENPITIPSTSALSIELNHEEKMDERIQCIERKEELLRQLKANERPGNLYPLVKFRLANGQHRTILVEREKFTVDDEQHPSRPLLSREQFPLMLAWALSIHKSQGQTLKFVSVDLKRIFENGQAYVALSRAEHRRGLQVLNFSPSKIKTNEVVKEFYKNLKDAETVLHHVETGEINNKIMTPDKNGPIGFMTQVGNLHDIAASPDRFTSQYWEKRKSEKEEKKKRGIDYLMKQSTTKKKKSADRKDGKENIVEDDNSTEKNQQKEIFVTVNNNERNGEPDLSADMLGSDDEAAVLRDIFKET